jgi:hypothetical protein
MREMRPISCLIISVCVLGEVHATTKGLSQIVTPDLQPEGELSLSYQAQARDIGNPSELQAEIGITSWLEAAVFQGLSPSEQVFNAQVGLVQNGPWLLTTGFINWSTLGARPQPFLEAGYYTTENKWMSGVIRVHDQTQLILGWAHDFNEMWRFQLDYQSGSANFFTVGFTCNVTARLQFNPAVYLSNGSHTAVGYIVLTYTLPVWKPR